MMPHSAVGRGTSKGTTGNRKAQRETSARLHLPGPCGPAVHPAATASGAAFGMLRTRFSRAAGPGSAAAMEISRS